MPDAAEIWKSLDAEKIAEGIIPQYHPHLFACRIAYLMTDQPMKSRGKALLGKTTKLGGLTRFFASGSKSIADGPEMAIVFNAQAWETLSEAQRVALVDHHLAQIRWQEGRDEDTDGTFVLRGPDVSEFTEIIERHGLWQPDLATMGQVIRQLDLPWLDGPATESPHAL